MKKLLTLPFVALMFQSVAQQQPVLSQYMFNNYYFNPAYTGAGERYSFSLLHRSQWSGYKDYEGNSSAPQIQLFSATANLDSTGHSAGLLMSRDKVGFLTTFQATLSYTYRIMLTGKSTLALGVRGGFATRSVDYDDYIIKHPDDELIHEGKQSETRPDVTVGLWYDHEKYYVGISAKGIVARADYSTLSIENEKSVVISAGYHVALRPDWTLTPSAQFITASGRSMIQGSILLDHDKIFWTGLAYRHEDAASVLVGLSALEKKFLISYAFDYTTGNKAIKTGTSHEIMIACHIGRSSAKRRSRS